LVILWPFDVNFKQINGDAMMMMMMMIVMVVSYTGQMGVVLSFCGRWSRGSTAISAHICRWKFVSRSETIKDEHGRGMWYFLRQCFDTVWLDDRKGHQACNKTECWFV